MTRYGEALDAAEKCTEASPKWAKGYLRKASAFIYLERYEEAEKSCEFGYLLQHDRRLSRDIISQWVMARQKQMQTLTSNCFFVLPTGAQILSEKYYIVLLKVIQARIAAAGGMSALDMGHCLLAIYEEMRDIMKKFGINETSPMKQWIDALYTEPDPQSTTISTEHYSLVLNKADDFIRWLNEIDDLLYCIVRPIVALAFLVISTRSWVLQCAETGGHYTSLLTEACFPLFEKSILNTTEYIGYHIGALSGYLGSFIGRCPSITEEEAPSIRNYCEKLKDLLAKYPQSQMEYEDVKKIALHNLSIIDSMLQRYGDSKDTIDDMLTQEGVISGETARRLAKTKPVEVKAYIQKLLQEYEVKPAQSVTVDDAKNLIASAG